MTSPRAKALMQSLYILAAELGPLFIHSEHGTAVFNTTLETAGVIEAAFTGAAPAAATVQP